MFEITVHNLTVGNRHCTSVNKVSFGRTVSISAALVFIKQPLRSSATLIQIMSSIKEAQGYAKVVFRVGEKK